MENRLRFNGYISKPRVEFPNGNITKEQMQEMMKQPVKFEWDIIDDIVTDIFQRDWDTSSISFDNCTFAMEDDFNENIDEFIQFLSEQPEFQEENRENIKNALDNLYLLDYDEDASTFVVNFDVTGYDYNVDIDIDLLPYYEKFLEQQKDEIENNEQEMD